MAVKVLGGTYAGDERFVARFLDEARTAASVSPAASLTPPAGMVRVPGTIGMSEAEAEAVARAVGLAWRIERRVVLGQEPAPGAARRGPNLAL